MKWATHSIGALCWCWRARLGSWRRPTIPSPDEVESAGSQESAGNSITVSAGRFRTVERLGQQRWCLE